MERLFAPRPTLSTVALAGFLVWLPLQTPVAIVAFQYANVGTAAARAILVSKDLLALLLLGYFVAVGWRSLRLRWFDWFAIAYVVLVAAYSVVPYLAGSSLPLVAVAASARQFLVPVELYAVGRAAHAAGARVPTVLAVFVGVSLAAAIFTVGIYAVFPASFWATTLDLVTFERVVQGLPNARSLADISILGHYGVGEIAVFSRAVGPFTHPVGAAHYFVLPLVLTATWVVTHFERVAWERWLVPIAAAVLFAFALIVPISRASWIAAGIAVLGVGFLYRRVVPAVAAVAAAAVFVTLMPPFSLSIASAISGTDSSFQGHQEALEHGVDTVGENPFGLGLGQADQFGDAFSSQGGATADQATASAVGENLYLAILVSVGPLGLLSYLLWLVGVGATLWPGLRPTRAEWAHAAAFFALLGLALAAMTASSMMRFTTSGSLWLIVGLLTADRIAFVSGRRNATGASPHAAEPT